MSLTCGHGVLCAGQGRRCAPRWPTARCCASSQAGAEASTLARRAVLLSASTLLLSRVESARALPLAPLGPPVRQPSSTGKRTGSSDAQALEVLARSLSEGRYFVNAEGKPTELFADDCRFRDPTNDIVGLKRYVTALGLLFEPASSDVQLLDIAVSAPRQVTARWTLGGYLKLPWHPYVPPFEGKAVYTLNDEGLVVLQDESWSISPLEALRETFTPTQGPSL